MSAQPNCGKNRDAYELFTDEWGLVWKRPADGLYFDVVGWPLAGDIDQKDTDRFP